MGLHQLDEAADLFGLAVEAEDERLELKDLPRFEGRPIGATGLRRDESVARAKPVAWKRKTA